MNSKLIRNGLLTGFVLVIILCTEGQAQLFNFPPSANADVATTSEDTPVKLNVIANDTDVNGNLDPATVDLNIQVVGKQDSVVNASGKFKVDLSGELTYTPTPGFNGSARISYVVSDSQAAVSNSANITITVKSVNVAPVAVADNATTSEDVNVTVNVIENDTDSDGTIDTAKVDLDVAANGVQKSKKTDEGEFSVNKGVVTYKPKSKFTGTAKIDYVVSDNEGGISNPATIAITVSSVNKPPIAANDTGATLINKPVSLNVVSNDTDTDGSVDPSKVDLNVTTAGIQTTANTAQGSFSVISTGEVTYTPIASFTGPATVSYTVNDNGGATSNVATITITVNAANAAPVAVNDIATTNKNKAVTIKPTTNDTDSDGTIDVTKVDINTTLAGIQNANETQQGTWAVNAAGVVTYTPANNFTGVAALAYTVNDNGGSTSNEATINVTVQNVNSPPVAVADNGATSQNTLVTINVIVNDTDSDGVIDATKVDLNTTTTGIQNTNTTTQGTYTVNTLGIVTYTPAKNFTGSATLAYTVSDNTGAVSNAVNITIAVQPVNAPVANEDKATTKMNVAVDINVVDNDKDTDGTIDVATVDVNTTVAGIQNTNTTPQGSFTANAQGVVKYVPKADFFGAVVLKYTVNDNKGVVSNAANISVTVEEVLDAAPVISAFEEETDTLRYTPGRPQALTTLFEVTDDDDKNLTKAEIGFVTQTYASNDDKLVFKNTDKISGSFNSLTGLLTLNGIASIADYVAAVRSVEYSFTGVDEFRDNIKRVYLRVRDDKSFSVLKERVIRVNTALVDLDIPTAFTPNSDGSNDTWRILAPGNITGSEFADAVIKVYDKRGTEVFGVNGLGNTWDGTYQGKLLPVDTYYYTIDLRQQQKRYKGVVAILR